jgi:hypothetical protein
LRLYRFGAPGAHSLSLLPGATAWLSRFVLAFSKPFQAIIPINASQDALSPGRPLPDRLLWATRFADYGAHKPIGIALRLVLGFCVA